MTSHLEILCSCGFGRAGFLQNVPFSIKAIAENPFMIQRKDPGHFQVRQVLESILRNLHRQSCLTHVVVNIAIIYRRDIIKSYSRFIWLGVIVFAKMTFKQDINV